MIREILQIGNPKLRIPSTEVDLSSLKSQEITKLKQDLVDTLRAQKAGVAISAIQIGSPHSLFVVEIKPTPNRPDLKPLGPLYFFNPEIISKSDETVEMPEACLSVMNAELYGQVTRPEKVVIKYIDENGKEQQSEYDGFLGRVIQHEISHLKGEIFTDIADPKTLMSASEYRKQKSKQAQKKSINDKH